jgi:ribose 1,5-bisphosphokinase PhnN
LCAIGTLDRVFAVLLTGPPGAGKTSVLTALSDALSDDDIAHASVETEALVWTHPALSDEQWTRHVRAICALHRNAGHQLLLIAQTLETDEDIAQLQQAVGADEHLLVRLEAPPDTLVERIVAREPESWSGLRELVAHAQELAATMPALRGIDLVLSTEGQRPEAVARRIRDAHPGRLRKQSTAQ